MNAQDTNSIFGSEEMPLAPPTSDEKTLAILAHILAIVPGIGILGPLIIYLLKKNDSEFVAMHARESLNFQITVLLAYLVAFVLVIILIGLLMFWVIGIVNVVLVIVATIRAAEGKLYRYPLSVRLVS